MYYGETFLDLFTLKKPAEPNNQTAQNKNKTSALYPSFIIFASAALNLSFKSTDIGYQSEFVKIHPFTLI